MDRQHNSWSEAIETGARLLGSQNAVARHIGSTSANLANCKSGRCVLTVAQIERLAELVGDTPEHLWTLMQLVRLKHRNPLQRKP